MRKSKFAMRIVSILTACTLLAITAGNVRAQEQAGTKLTPADSVHRFDLGSMEQGGSGVEGTKNWIKIVQNSNNLRLFENVEQGTDVAALQVRFEISNWSGIEFPITWGANLNFTGEKSSTWCGTSAFEGISSYLIDREGEYTVTCDLAALCREKGKEGISWLQTCEMVIDNLTEGDKTVINVIEAVIYQPGEKVPQDNATKIGIAQADTIVIDPLNVSRINNGVFEGWGSSLCWYGNRIGGSEKAGKEAAELLYNSESGLGLNILRYNIGGGDNPEHNHIQRSDSVMPGYWTDYNPESGEFSYDFTKDANQQNVLFWSLEECPDMLVEMFSNSAPYFMTRSGCTSGTNDEIKSNLTIENMPAFAEYMAEVVKYFVDEGVNVVSVEPMNEPSNGWNVSHYGVKQEGCSIAAGQEQSALLAAMNAAMEKYGLSHIRLAGCDETNDTATNISIKKMTEEALGLLDQINTHTYSRNETSSSKLNRTALELEKRLWMTETDNGGILGENAGEMGAALNLASLITGDLNSLQPSAWILWQAIGSYCDENNEFDPDTLSRKELDSNGFWGVCYADMNEETIVKTKKYYAFGQYTRYIRPGDNLIAAEDNYTIAAYNSEKEELKIVTYNPDSEDREVCFDLTAFAASGSRAEAVRTSGDYETGENWAVLEDLQVTDGKISAVIKKHSVTTFVVHDVRQDMAAVLAQLNSMEEQPAEPKKEAEEIQLVDGRPVPETESVTARICFASGDWSYTVMADEAETVTGLSVSTMENGSYSLRLPAPEGTQVLGTVVFCIDLPDYARQITGMEISELKTEEEKSAYDRKIAETVKVTVSSITQDGKNLEIQTEKIVVGDTEDNGNLRVEIYNLYGPTAEEGAIEPEEIDFTEELVIGFEVELAAMSEEENKTPPTTEEEKSPAEESASEESLAAKSPAAVVIAATAVIAAAAVVLFIRQRKKTGKYKEKP